MTARTKTKREMRDSDIELTRKQIEYLIRGSNLVKTAEPAFTSEDEARKAWRKHRRFFMDLIGQGEFGGVGFPRLRIDWGFRPYGWWQYDHSGARRELLAGSRNAIIEGSGYRRGVPPVYTSYEDFKKLVWESEFDFLERNTLLLPGEAEGYKKDKERRERKQSERDFLRSIIFET